MFTPPVLIGLALAPAIVALGRLSGLDRDRALYPVTLIVIAAYYVLFATMGGAQALPSELMAATVFAVAVALFLSFGSYFGGDALVLAASRAHAVSEAAQPELVHVVQELAIAANVPMPKVYVIEDTAPNAFATVSPAVLPVF